jgi:hypothetical protein
MFTRRQPKVLTSQQPPQPSANNIRQTRVGYGTAANNATAERAQASALTTGTAAGVGSIWAATAGLNAAHLVAASAAGASVAVPALAPAALGVIVACIFVMRQRGLNKELLSNLYFIKMEVERMSRIQNVVKVIAKENHINLNTASLSLIMVALQRKILLFADAHTKEDIRQLEEFLQHDDVAAAKELAETADTEVDGIVKRTSQRSINTSKGQAGGNWLPTGWASRWLAPDETLRQIIRDITIANVWFSVMLGEFDIFMRFIGNSTSEEWKKSKAMKELLVANRQLGTTTAVNRSTNSDYDMFYSVLDMKEAAAGVVENLQEPQAAAAAGGSRYW